MFKGALKKYLLVVSNLQEPLMSNFITYLEQNLDVFACPPSDMLGIDLDVSTRKLNVYPQFKPIQQKKWNLGQDKQKATKEEVDKLFQAGFIREIMYPQWLENMVMVKKSNEKWRMRIHEIMYP